jgi:hypothetical protein
LYNRRSLIKSSLAIAAGALLSESGLAQLATIEPPQSRVNIEALMENVYGKITASGRQAFHVDLTVIAKLGVSDKDELMKLAPLVLRDQLLEELQPGFYDGQPTPVIEAVDAYMPAQYQAIATMRKILNKMKDTISPEEYETGNAWIDERDPNMNIIRLPDHGIWYNIHAWNMKNRPLRQVLWLECKDAKNREVEVRASRQFMEGETENTGGVNFFIPHFDEAAPYIQARYKNQGKWNHIYTQMQKTLGLAYRDEMMSALADARNPIKGMIRKKSD